MSKVIRSYSVNIDKENIYNYDLANQVNFSNTQQNEDSSDNNNSLEKEQNIKVSILQQASKEAESIINSAKMKAVEILASAENEAKEKAVAIREDAEKNGYEDGYKKGEKKAKLLEDEAQRELEAALSEKEHIIQTIEPQMVDIVVNCISHIFGSMAVLDRQIVVNLIRQGLNEATITGNINIRVSQKDFENVIKSKEEITSIAEGAVTVEILKDVSLKASDCIIETPFGNIDCSLDKQLEGLKNGLYYILNNRG